MILHKTTIYPGRFSILNAVILFFALLVFNLPGPSFASSRIKDLAEIEGVRENQLIA